MESQALTELEKENKLERELDPIAAGEIATIDYYGQKVGEAQMWTGFKAFVTSDTGQLPHIHIDQLSGDRKKVCVYMLQPKYFTHAIYPDRFTTKELKEFDTFLRSNYRSKLEGTEPWTGIKYRIQTNWEYAIYQWNIENLMAGKIDLPVNDDGYVIFPKQPDFTKMEN